MRTLRYLCTGAAVAFLLVLAVPTLAGGLYLYEIGTPDVGTAAAGYAARAQDASTVFTNPAGMTRLDRPEIQFGIQPMYVDLKFSPDSSTNRSGPNGDASAWIPAGSMFYVQPLSKDVRLGFGMFGNFGLSLQYEDDWVGRYYVQEATLQSLTFMPSVAYRVSPQISVGAGLGIVYAIFENKVAIPNRQLFDPLPDGQLKLDDHDWSVNGKFGILYELTKATRFGVTYTTQTVLKFKNPLEWSGLGPGLEAYLRSSGKLDSRLDLGMREPQAVMVSVFHDLTDRLALLANVGWEQWSRFGKIDVGFVDNTTRSLTTDLDYKDTWHGALGAQYRLSDPWLLSFGVAYDSSMLDDDQRSPSLPVGDTWRFALGGQYRWSPKVTLSGAYELAWGGNLPLNVSRGPVAGTVSGEYKDTAIHVIDLTMNYKF
jgi:long-chain fatty acid transport protein